MLFLLFSNAVNETSRPERRVRRRWFRRVGE
jgi:hypothetical protein